MKEFIFRKNLWTLDLIAALIFALGFGYGINLISDNSKESERINLIYGTLAYAVTFAFALGLRKRCAKIPSWVWLGVFGALARIVILQLIWLPLNWQHPHRIFDKIYYLFVGTAFNWLFWAIPCLICIFTVRIIAYIFRSRLYLP